MHNVPHNHGMGSGAYTAMEQRWSARWVVLSRKLVNPFDIVPSLNFHSRNVLSKVIGFDVTWYKRKHRVKLKQKRIKANVGQN